jgi:SH3-like domain-containing protein
MVGNMIKLISQLSLAATLAGAAVAPVQAASDPGFPSWRSLRDPVVNMRVGPGEDYAIRFVYHRQNLPIKVLRLYQGWYLVEDPDGARGWMNARFVNRTPTALIRGKGPVEMHAGPAQGSPLLWKLAPGNVGRVGPCQQGWCEFTLEARKGFVPQDRLWGAGTP